MARVDRVAKGRWVEDQVAAWLDARGLLILQRNYRVPGGELDLIAQTPGREIVIVEVRSRDLAQPGLPEETLSQTKQAFLGRAAVRWLVEQDLWERVPVRFDVVAVDTKAGPEPGEYQIHDIRWIKSAFDYRGRY